jgi:hypothetical protein
MANAQPIEDEDEPEPGLWLGKVGFIEQDNLIFEDSIFDITDTYGRRFFGSATVGEIEFDTAGTASASGVISTVGKTPDRRGTATGLHGLAKFGDGAAVLLGEQRFNGNGTSNTGAQILMRQFDFDPATDPLPPSVGGGWEGFFVSELDGGGEIASNLTAGGRGSATRFGGELSYIEQDNLHKFSGLEGSINSEGNVVMTGLGLGGPGEVLVIVLEGDHVVPPPRDAGPPPSPTITGTYSIYSLRPGGLPKLVDFGSFMIIAILIG